ncbi:MAG TPA: DUF5009 domain-containing protein [Gemmataceae bacterium]|nr:DUF5009 domain-containing protein [Gemmataceae bacterium]
MFRGFVMFLMLAEAMRLWTLHTAFPESRFWSIVAYNTSHVPWQGCSLHDLIQPAFSFLVGAAMPFSLAKRQANGESFGRMLVHAIYRSVALMLLGIFLRSLERQTTYWTFEDTLTQIGLGYTFLFLLAFASLRTQIVVFVAILVGFWGAFALYPLPGPDFDYTKVGVRPDWPYLYTGFLAHFNKNSNLSWAFDTWFLNLFPREKPFLFNGGGYATLSFLPTLGTMILGLIAGAWLRATGSGAWQKVRRLAVAGLVLIAAGWAADALGVCPSVKRIWTPAWTLFSGGWCLLLLAGFYAVMDAAGYQSWAFPLKVIGANSIVAYCMAHLIEDFIITSFQTHLGAGVFEMLGPAYAPLLSGATVLLVYWLILWWMYRRGVFLRI